MAEKKRKWWLVLIPVLLIAVILTAVFWDAILIYTAPKAVLTQALADAFSQLEDRFQNDPLLILGSSFNTEGQYTADVQVDTTNKLLGDVAYDMTVQADMAANQVFAEGSVNTAGKELALSVYLNGDFMALSSKELLQGNYYGITYETFSEDINGFPLLKWMVPEKTISQWETSVENIQTQMNRSYSVPEVSDEDFRLLLAGLLTMKCQVGKAEIPLNGEQISCRVLSYGANGAQVKELLSYVLDTGNAENCEISGSFYLYENVLVQLALDGSAGENHVRYVLTLGQNAITDDLTLQIARTENGSIGNKFLQISTQQDTAHYAETVKITSGTDDIETSLTVSYDRDLDTGDMLLNWDNAMPIRLNLEKTENGFRLKTDDFAQLIAALSSKEGYENKDISCTMTLSKGSEIVTPTYKNMDQWSMEDLLTLLGGIGSLIGVNLE